MLQEKFSLTWQSYSDHLKVMMKDLMMNEDFSDVTLVTEDKKQIWANINILSACSPVFKDILKKDKHSKSIMYLRGVKFSELESMMQFIYLGETTFLKERSDEFFAVAKSLEITELCNAKNEFNNHPDGSPKFSPNDQDQDTSNELVQEKTVTSNNINKQASQQKQESVRVNGKFKRCHKTNSGALSTDKQSVRQGANYVCNQCAKQFTAQASLIRHILSKHEGVKYPCDQCDFQTTTHDNLTVHIRSKHEGVKYACDQCDYQVAHRSNLIKHIEIKHEGVRYACNQCDYQAKTQFNVTLHIQSKHEGLKFSCDQCDFQSSHQSSLRIHIQSRHEGIKYACDQCDQQFTQKCHLRMHIKKKHEV